MPETIKTGTVLIKDGALLPDALQFESEPCATGWRLVTNLDGYALDCKIHEAGWTFFCMAGEIKTIVCGFERAKERSEGRQANPGEDELGEVQFFGNHASGLETLPGSVLCESLGLFKAYPGKFVSFP